MLPPPGGEEERDPPELVAVLPESLGVYPNFRGEVEFIFDEVVSEGSTPNIGLGTGDLERLILLSPSPNVPRVSWKRQRITVRPKEGWKPNRVYRVELLPGVTDLLRNRSDTSVVLTFSTGAPAPTDTLRGLAIDWLARKAATNALLEMILTPDSLVYRAVSDSGGRFAVGPMPRGQYLLFAAVDQNRNLRRDAREAFDSIRVRSDSGREAILWMFVHDTVGPRIQTIQPNDSVSATITFSHPLDPYQRVDSLTARVRLLPDSAPVAIRSLRHQPVDDSIEANRPLTEDELNRAFEEDDSLARLDSIAAARDSVVPRPQRPGQPPRRAAAARDTSAFGKLLATRPALSDKLVVRMVEPFTPGAKYVFEVEGIRNANGAQANARSGFSIPERPPPAAPADSGPAPADSAAPDTTPRRPE